MTTFKTKEEIEEMAKRICPTFGWGHPDDREIVEKQSGFITGYTQAQQDIKEACSEGFEEWFEDHEINGFSGDMLNYEETCFGDRPISVSDIEYNSREAYEAGKISSMKELILKTNDKNNAKEVEYDDV